MARPLPIHACHLDRAPRRLLERVPALPEGIVSLRRQADVDLAGGQPLPETRYRETNGRVMAGGFAPKINPAPVRIPRCPELEPGEVVEKVAVHRASPIDHRTNPVVCNQDIEIEQVAVNEMPPFRTLRDQRSEA